MAETENFATPEDMADRTLGQITEASHPFLQRELDAATQDIRDFCRWHVAPSRQLTYRRAGRRVDDVWLPAMEIQTVDAVTIDGTVFDANALSGVEFDPSTGWTNLRGRSVVVKYTAGFEKVPANLVTATLELAATALGTSLGFAREQAGTVSVTFDRAGGGVDAGSAGGQRLIAYQLGRLP